MKRIILAALVGVLVSGSAGAAESEDTLCTRIEAHAFDVLKRIEVLDFTKRPPVEKYDAVFGALSDILSAMDDADCGLDYIRNASKCLKKRGDQAFDTEKTTKTRLEFLKEYADSCKFRDFQRDYN